MSTMTDASDQAVHMQARKTATESGSDHTLVPYLRSNYYIGESSVNWHDWLHTTAL